MEVVLYLHLRPNLGVGPLNLILEILNIFLRLNSTDRLEKPEPDSQFLNHFQAAIRNHLKQPFVNRSLGVAKKLIRNFG